MEDCANEYSGGFTGITPNTSKNMKTVNDDTDIEAGGGFNAYSEDTFQKKYDKREEGKTKAVTLRPAAESVSLSSKPPPCLQSSRCSTQCASTYHNYRNRRKTLAVLSNDAIKKSLLSEDSDDTSASSTSCTRKISKFWSDKTPEKKLIEGIFKHSTSINYEEYLAAIGTGPCSQDLVMKAGMVLRINQELDKQWRISTETVIQAKSVRGFRTNNRKWTENKFKEGELKPELMDDWDQRLVVTLMEVNDGGTKLTLKQVAEKDQLFAKDSIVEMEVDQEQPDLLIMTCSVYDIVGWRTFERQMDNSKFSERKSSSPF